MTAVETKTKFTKEEREAFHAKREEFRKELRALTDAQIADKKLLRMPHYSLPEVTIKAKWGEYKTSGTARAAGLMATCRTRAATISGFLDAYWSLKGGLGDRSHPEA
jgi:hypothetical protein